MAHTRCLLFAHLLMRVESIRTQTEASRAGDLVVANERPSLMPFLTILAQVARCYGQEVI